MSQFRLEGIEPDNLLALLAFLGLLRAIDQAEPKWRVRAWWDGTPFRPEVSVKDEVDRETFLEAAARGCAALAEVHEFGDNRDLQYSREDARAILREAALDASSGNRLRIDLMSALMSDGALKDDAKVRAPVLCAMFGQGHQHFLERMKSVPRGTVPKEIAKKVTSKSLNSPAKLEQALFLPWNRSDATQSFRWDPAEDRRYALRYADPSTDKGLTVHGANRLASVGLPLLFSAPTRAGGEIRLITAGSIWARGVNLTISWPIWRQPASLAAVRNLMAGAGNESSQGIVARYRCERISAGKFFNFTYGTVVED
jgi:hypothetical protein